jgi:hypothetical protein
MEVHPTTIIVANTNNSGPGSLRQAILDNNGLGGGNLITFSNGVAGTIKLNVELGVSAPVTLRGPGPELLAISGNNRTRVLTVLAGPTVVAGVTICDGRVEGGDGNQGNDGFEARGGGIYSQESLTLSNCVVRSNSVVGGMGGERHLGQVGRGGRGIGGGLYNAGSEFTLINSYFIGNRAIGGQGGPAQNGEAGEGGNGLGGAIGTGGGTNPIVACEFADNLAQGGAGGISGGGEHGIGGQGWGGSLYSESEMSIRATTIRGGSAQGGVGGGGNGSGYGGGIYNMAGLGLHSCTIAANRAGGSSFDFGGAVYSVGSAGLTHCTIAGNDADYGGGWDGNATVANSIFARNAAGSGADFNGTMNSFDYNLVQSFAGLNILGATGNVLIGVDPMLGSLQANGGPTFTMTPLPGSPVIDKGHSFGATTDQRGLPRARDLLAVANATNGDGSDIGAVESYPSPLLNIQRANASEVVLSWTADAADYRLQAKTSLAPSAVWTDVATPLVVSGNQVFVTIPASGPAGNFRLVYP